MSLQPVSERLSLDMLKAVTKSLDTNRNNRIDESEVSFMSYRSLREASRDASGYANDVVGTTEMAKAIQAGRVTLQGLPPAVSDRIANALTNGDAWMSHDDFGVSEQARRRLDANGDGRVSRRELADALTDGTLVVGSSFEMNLRPDYEPPYIPPTPVPHTAPQGDYDPPAPPVARRNSP